MLCWPPPFLSSPAIQSSLNAAHWPTNSRHRGSISEYLTPDLKQSQLPPPLGNGNDGEATVHLCWYHIHSTVAYSGSWAYCATVGGTFGHDQLLMMSRSLITLLSDQALFSCYDTVHTSRRLTHRIAIACADHACSLLQLTLRLLTINKNLWLVNR